MLLRIALRGHAPCFAYFFTEEKVGRSPQRAKHSCFADSETKNKSAPFGARKGYHEIPFLF